MRGDLSETSVADLCRALADARATGAVELEGPVGDARVFFRAGNVYWAVSPAPRARLGDRLVNAGLLTQEELDRALDTQRSSEERTKLGALLVEQGLVTRDVIRVFVQEQILDALFDLMRYRTGGYVFRAGEAVDEKLPIDIPVDQLLVEVSRRQSEWDQIQSVIPHLDMVPDFVTGASSANAALEPDEFAILASVDGQRSIRDLAEDLGYSEFEAARIVYGLTLLGIVDVRDAAPDDEATEGELELDLGSLVADDDVAGTSAAADADGRGGSPQDDAAPDENDIDIAAALEAAMAEQPERPERPPRSAPSAASPTTGRPAVRVHVDDDVRDYVSPRTIARQADDEEAPAPAEPAVEVTEGPASTGRDDDGIAQLTEALTAALDEPVDGDDAADVGAEPAAEEAAAADEPDAAGQPDDVTEQPDEAREADGEPDVAEAPEHEPDVAEAPGDEPDDVAAEPDGPAVAEAPEDVAEVAGVPDEAAATAAPEAPVAPVPDAATDVDEPEPWVAGPDPEPGPDEWDAPAAATTSAPTAASEPDSLFGDLSTTASPAAADDAAADDDLDDDDVDFTALLGQLSQAPEGSTDDAPPRPRPAPEPPAARSEESEPAAASSSRDGGDVSEFLRELSRLSLEEEDEAGTEEGRSEARRDAGAAAGAAASSRDQERRQAAERRDDKNKKRGGLFGWGR